MSAVVSEDVLTEGEWVIRNGVQVWVERPFAPPPAPKTYDLTKLIACPSCHAKVTETCRTARGRRTTPHSVRLTLRLCLCGTALGHRRRLCDPCRDAQIQAAKNDYLRRARAGAA